MYVSNKAFLLFAGVLLYLVFTYQDTQLFQSIMVFLFSPVANSRWGGILPEFWIKWRIFIITALIFLLWYLYRPSWSSYTKTIEVFRKTPPTFKKPSLPPLQATYLYRQDRNIFKTWLIESSIKRIITLHHTNGVHPWAISRGEKSPVSELDQKLIATLFANDQPVRLKACISAPNPPIRDAFIILQKHLKAASSKQFRKQMSALPLYLILICLLVEIPFQIASLEGTGSSVSTRVLSPFIGVFIVILSAFPSYAISQEILSVFEGPKAKAIITIIGATFIGVVGLLLLYLEMIGNFYPAMIYIPILTSMAIIATNAPQLAVHQEQFTSIIAFKKYLNKENTQIIEDDLPWTIGLDVQTDINCSLCYKDTELPRWLNTAETSPGPIIKELHETLERSVRESIYGEMKSRRRRSGIGDMSRSG